MFVPRVGSEISKDWLQRILEDSEKQLNPQCKVIVNSFTIAKGAKPGEAFNSELSTVVVKTQVQKEEHDPAEYSEYNLYFKFSSMNVFSREANSYLNSNDHELQMYSSVFQKLMALQEQEADAKYPLSLPKLYYGYNKKDDFVMVMDNMKSYGYIVSDKNSGLNFQQLKVTLEQIARWHALSYAYDKKCDFLKQYPQYSFREDAIAIFKHYSETSLRNILLMRDPEFEVLLTKANIKSVQESFIAQLLSKDEDKIRTLIHGDLWNNNLLFKYEDTQTEPIDVKLIDWQMAHWNRPVIDLHYLLYTSTTSEVRRSHLQELLKIYYSTFYDVTTAMKCPPPGYTFDVFREEFFNASVVGFVYGVILSQGTLSKAGEKIMQPSTSTGSPRSLSFKLRCRLARLLVPLTMDPALEILTKMITKKMFKPIGLELAEGKNGIMNDRLRGLMREAKENKIFGNHNMQLMKAV